MAEEEIDEVEVIEEDVDNARDLTSGIVFTTTVVLIASLWVVFEALSKYHGVGPLAGN